MDTSQFFDVPDVRCIQIRLHPSYRRSPQHVPGHVLASRGERQTRYPNRSPADGILDPRGQIPSEPYLTGDLRSSGV